MIQASQAMMNASQVKTVTIAAKLAEIGMQIETASKKGLFSFTYNLTQTDLPELLSTEIKKFGYKVRHNHGHDQRDGDSWNQLIISWD